MFVNIYLCCFCIRMYANENEAKYDINIAKIATINIGKRLTLNTNVLPK